MKRFLFCLKIIIALVCVLLIYRMIQKLGPDRVLESFRQADVLQLGCAALLLQAYFLLWAFKWFKQLQHLGPLPFSLSVRLIYAGAFINLVTPTAKLGGGFFRGLALRDHFKWSLPRAYGPVLADQLDNTVAKALMFGLAATVGAFLPELRAYKSILLLSGSIALVLGLSWPGYSRRWFIHSFRRFISRLPFSTSGQDKQNLFATLKASPQVVWLNLGGMCLALMTFFWSQALVFSSMDVSLNFWSLSLAVLMAYLLGSFLGIMGGAGVTELLLIQLFGQLGVAQETAAAVALLHRALFYLSVLVLGGIATWLTPLSSKVFAPKA